MLLWQHLWLVWADSSRPLPEPVLHSLLLGISVLFIVPLIHLWKSICLFPSQVNPIGHPQLYWVIDMGLLPLVPYLNMIFLIQFPVHSFILLLLYPDPIWFTSLSTQLLWYWFSCILWFHNTPCDTAGPVNGPKTSPIFVWLPLPLS